MFPRKLLIPGEDVVVELRPHPVALAGPVLAMLVATLAEWWVAARFDGLIVWIAWAAWIALMLGFVIPKLVAWWTSIFVISTDRVISREGFIAKRSMEIPLEQVNDVRFEQGIFDRIVGAGTLLIQSASTGGTNSFDDIRRPEEVQRTIFHQGELNQQRAGRRSMSAHDADAPTRPDGPATPPSPVASSPASPSVTTELERLADLRARGILTEEEFQAQKARILGR
jgi:uncharacterized membrane protein YdbT with pleckstrin-like domain